MFFLLAAIPLSAQDISPNGDISSEEGEPSEGAITLPPDDSTLYVIAAYEFTVNGRSRRNALLYKLIEHGEFREGEVITGRVNLEKYIGVVTQIYINQRVLKDNVEVSYSTGARNEDGTFPVTIMTKVEDTWNIIALPRPYYKNGVFDFTVKGRDYNFLGTMNPLRVDVGYNYNEDKQHSFLLGVYSDTPFMAFGYYWNLTFDNTIQYRVNAPFYYQNTTGLSMELPFRSTTFTFGINERVYLNDENPDWAKDKGYPPYQDDLYMSSSLYVSWKIPTGLTLPLFGELIYTPVISSTFNHEFPKWPLADFLRGPFLNFGHTLDFEKIDWHGNYRKGLSLSIGNSYQYGFNQKSYEISVNITGIGHFIVKDFFAVSTRLMYQYWYFSGELREGDYASYYLRGIADNSITAYQMLLLNLDFPFRLFVFKPSKWFNKPKLRFFDFELQLAPVIDMALYYQKEFDNTGKTLYGSRQIAASGGLELIVFPEFMRNLFIRIGFAVNMKEFIKTRRMPGGENREIYVIMGHFY